jgi:predicted dienelactone hydrolase
MIRILFLITLLWSCNPKNTSTNTVLSEPRDYEVRLDTTTLFDASRNRNIPVAYYSANTKVNLDNQPVVIFSHGYNENRPGGNLSYAGFCNFLASKGFFVVSIQHELATDSLLPMTGIPQITRRSNWERGAENIKFVLNHLKSQKTNRYDFQKVSLIGHSNGGDMSMLFAHKYPDQINKVISLDNRRMLLPRTKSPQVYSLRSSDQPADEGVLPTEEEMKEFNITEIKLPNTIHNHMDDEGTQEQIDEINRYLLAFLTTGD